ncbi:phytanoyl-CoA dioxygenase family protein [Burkholderia plantarii]|uniref:phytanoyl-CoA dioxygenase family protein n=1 Tax=Burkholderia plantarii TaxID=41899 RepID=UPI0006D8AEA3|nr:phytanoyl-CoA dioxygenase family protein [Burkholderia plantarii]ALK32701.1 phytanoyl-CoA dioxygenase [Burkholderia plantarii]GLZ22987.1 hypothetical protein Bpla01_65160 [Burkholderia plantarii]
MEMHARWADAASNPTSADTNHTDNNTDSDSSALDRFIADGHCTFGSPFSPGELDTLREHYLALLDAKMRRFGLHGVAADQALLDRNDAVLNDFKPKGGNHDLNRWNMHLPSHGPLFDERLFNDPRVMAIVDRLIGPDAVCYLIASDTPLPGAGFQGAHQDFTRFSIALNIPLVDVTEHNGPTEIWPGTHCGGRFDTQPYFIAADEARQISATRRPRRLTNRAGSFVLRDHRLLHRGTANRSDASRPMLSLYYVQPGPVPYAWLARAGVWLAERVRKAGRGASGGGAIANQRLLNLGNLLGRIVEESVQSDRDYRRPIEQHRFDALSPRARHLLRYARVAGSHGSRALVRGSWAGSRRFVRRWFGACASFIGHELRRTPRQPD